MASRDDRAGPSWFQMIVRPYRPKQFPREMHGAVVVALLFTFAVVGVANGGNDLGHKAGGNSTVTFLKYKLTSVVSSAFDYNDTNNIEFSDITTTIYTTTNADNDIYYPKEVNVYDFDYGDVGWFGRWDCNTWGAGNSCSVGIVNINLYPMPPLPLNNTEARSLVCEEVGHAVGLAHDFAATNTCMSQDWNDTLLNGHDVGILNGRY